LGLHVIAYMYALVKKKRGASLGRSSYMLASLYSFSFLVSSYNRTSCFRLFPKIDLAIATFFISPQNPFVLYLLLGSRLS